MMDHMSGARENIEHASRHRSVKPLRLRFQVDDRIGVTGEDGDRTGQFGIAVRHPPCIGDHVGGVLGRSPDLGRSQHEADGKLTVEPCRHGLGREHLGDHARRHHLPRQRGDRVAEKITEDRGGRRRHQHHVSACRRIVVPRRQHQSAYLIRVIECQGQGHHRSQRVARPRSAARCREAQTRAAAALLAPPPSRPCHAAARCAQTPACRWRWRERNARQRPENAADQHVLDHHAVAVQENDGAALPSFHVMQANTRSGHK